MYSILIKVIYNCLCKFGEPYQLAYFFMMEKQMQRAWAGVSGDKLERTGDT